MNDYVYVCKQRYVYVCAKGRDFLFLLYCLCMYVFTLSPVFCVLKFIISTLKIRYAMSNNLKETIF